MMDATTPDSATNVTTLIPPQAGPIEQPKKLEVRLYRVIAGELDDTDGPISLELVQKFGTVGQATQYLHSKECFTKHIRDAGVEVAEFLIVNERHHYQIKPIHLYITQPMTSASADKQQGKILG